MSALLIEVRIGVINSEAIAYGAGIFVDANILILKNKGVNILKHYKGGTWKKNI